MSNSVATVETQFRLPYPAQAAQMSIDSSAWQTLVNAVFPTAKTSEGVLLALSYCKARKLDVFKRPVHIVPIRTKLKTPDGKDYWADIETVWPGINELRTTAFRTGVYAGADPASFGPDVTSEWELPSGDDSGGDHPNAPPREAKAAAAAPKIMKVVHPEWCQVTVYRLVAGQRIAFPGPRVYWLETYATAGKSDRPNEMWKDRPRGQLEKCAEAAALRKGFPEELGGEHIVEEAPRMVDITPTEAPASRPDREEITAPAKQKKQVKAATVEETPAANEKADGRNGNDGSAAELSETATDHASTTSAPSPSEGLQHALASLPKMPTVEELEGAKASLKKSLSPDEFVIWHTAALERVRELKGRR